MNKNIAVKIVYCNGAEFQEDIEYRDLKVLFLLNKNTNKMVEEYLNNLGYEFDGMASFTRKDKSDFSFMFLKYVSVEIDEYPQGDLT